MIMNLLVKVWLMVMVENILLMVVKADQEEDSRKIRQADWWPKRLPNNYGQFHLCHQTLSGEPLPLWDKTRSF